MTIELISQDHNSAGSTGANQRNLDEYRWTLRGETGRVLINSMAAPIWTGDENLDQDDRSEILTAIDEA
jgi:hypothetical protein